MIAKTKQGDLAITFRYEGRLTICDILEVQEGVPRDRWLTCAAGSVCRYAKDAQNKPLARKLALTNACAFFDDKETRGALWRAYLTRNRRFTERGFRLYAVGAVTRDGVVMLQESSIALEGAHVWLRVKQNYLHGEHDDQKMPHASTQLNVAQAKHIRDALDEFVKEAEANDLIEPAYL